MSGGGGDDDDDSNVTTVRVLYLPSAYIFDLFMRGLERAAIRLFVHSMR